MRYILIILTSLMIFALLNSCEDSLGLDQYSKSLKERNPDGIKPSIVNKFTADSVAYHFKEYYVYDVSGNYQDTVDEKWNYTHYTKDVMLDTSGTNTVAWIHIKLVNKSPEFVYEHRRDRVYSFEIIMDSVVLDNNPFPKHPSDHFLDSEQDKGRWSSITVRNTETKQEKTFSELDARIHVKLIKTFSEFYDEASDSNVIRDYIKGILEADFEPSDSLETTKFKGEFIIFYK